MEALHIYHDIRCAMRTRERQLLRLAVVNILRKKCTSTVHLDHFTIRSFSVQQYHIQLALNYTSTRQEGVYQTEDSLTTLQH